MTTYNGLLNDGATCYLNSLIQTLFMTSQFRQNLYAYRHDPKKIKQSDSISFQLQKLFIQLQSNKSACRTKGLQKSFQWTQKDSFQQHDVQQFCRILFEAIQKAQKNSDWLKNLYSGLTSSYIDCGKHVRNKQQLYMDLSLPIRGFQSLEQCIKEYIKPETIQGVDCEQCAARVQVKKGLKFQSFPTILTIQLNRFQLNFDTMKRQKLNSFLYFPQILQLGKFSQPYNQIQLKQIPKDLKNKIIITEKQKSSRTLQYGFDLPKKIIERKKSFDKLGAKQTVKFFDQENRNKRQNQKKQLTIQQIKQQSKGIIAKLVADREEVALKMEKIKAKQLKQIQQDMLFGTAMGMADISWKSGQFQKQPSLSLYPKSEIKYEHEEQSYDPTKQYPDLTYALYAVLVHSGGAYGGHYFAYISDGKNWYKFDDSQVKQVNKTQIRKYGNYGQINSIHGSNAYMLFYKDIKLFKNSKNIEIPQDLLELIKKDEQIIKQHEQKRQIILDQLNKNLFVKIYKDQQNFETLTMEDRFNSNLGQLKQKIIEKLHLEEQNKNNWRLRRYNKGQDTMHQVYSHDLDNTTLQSLGFRQQIHVIIQHKTDGAQFQQYDPKKIIIKLNPWRENIVSLTQQMLKPTKIYVKDDLLFEQLYQQISTKLKIQNPIIIKRNFSVGNPMIQYALKEHSEKKLIQLRFFNCINLYIEQAGSKPLKWLEQFQNQQFRCLIHYNDPKQGQQRNHQLYFDSRKTLGQLKTKFSQLIGISQEDFRIKRTKNSVAELTTFKKKLSQLKIINNQYLYLEQGKSSKGSIIIRKGKVFLEMDRIEAQLLDETQIELDSKISTVEDLKNVLSLKYHIPSSRIRVRQYKSYQFGQIFLNNDLLQRIRDKSLVWEQLQEDQERGIQIYIRVFDIINMELGPLEEIFLDQQASYQQFAFIIQDKVGIPSDKILCWRSASPGVDKQYLLDCDWTEIKFIKKAIRQQPLYLNKDATLIIVKQAFQAYHPKLQTSNQSKHSGDPMKQASLRITVIEQNNQEINEKKQE